MFEDRNVKLDIFALALAAVVAFLAMALLSYDRADAVAADTPSSLVFPAPEQVNNVSGRMGAWTADRLLRLFGVGAFYLVASLAAVDVFLLLRRSVGEPVTRTCGWLMTLVGVTTLAAMAVPRLAPSFWFGPEIGPGGYLGAALRGLLEMNFAAAGSYILAFSLIAAGLLLSTDYWLLRFAAWSVALPASRMGGLVHRRASRRKQDDLPEKFEVFEEFEEEEEDEEVASEPNIRIGGRRRGEPEEVEEEEEDQVEEAEEVEEDEVEEEELDEAVAEDEEDDEAETDDLGKKSVGQRLTAALRIRTPKSKIRDAERQEVIEELDEAVAQEDVLADYQLPDLNLLLASEDANYAEQEREVRKKAKQLEKAFATFGYNVKVVEIETGPVIAQYELELEAGLRLSKITNLADDIAIALRVPSVRIVAPIPGKNTVGIEVPNTTRLVVRMREVMEEYAAKAKKMKIPIFLGKDVSGNPMVCDLATLPHLLIAGRTGTGKSVCLNSIITSMVMTRRPDEVKMLMIDPKMVELSPYKQLPHLMHPVVTDMRKAEAILAWAVEKMEERYALLASAGVRHVSVYNQLGEEELMDRIQPESEEDRQNIPLNLPYIVIVADEMADLMMTSGKEVEQHIIRLAQKSRAVGIHLVLATQKPTVDVITGLIKSNLPARIAFQVASRTDSRVVLDEMGADKLLGNGDMLFLWPGTSTLIRGQGTYLSDDEINNVIASVAVSEPQFAKELIQLKPAGAEESTGKERFKNRDELYEQAVDVIVREGRGSVSLLQRALGVGYGRGARLIDFMAEDGIVGEYNGSQAREVLITPEQWVAMQAAADSEGDEDPDPPPEPPKKRNRITLASRKREEDSDDAEADRDDYAAAESAEFSDDNEWLEEEEDEAEDDEEEEPEDELFEEEEEDVEEYEVDEYDEEESEEDDEEVDDEEAEEDEHEEDEYEEDELEEADDEEEYEEEEDVDEEDEPEDEAPPRPRRKSA